MLQLKHDVFGLFSPHLSLPYSATTSLADPRVKLMNMIGWQ
jgi:hypothetical protein